MPWICPNCKKEFKNPNQEHSCARVPIGDHFRNKPGKIRMIYDRIMQEVNRFGPYTVNPVKSSIQIKTGATFLARHVASDGPAAVESIKKGILNIGFSLIHMPYPCPTNFGSRHLGNRKPVNLYRWIDEHAAPLGQETEDTFWATGIWHDAANSRPEHSQLVREITERIGRTGKI